MGILSEMDIQHGGNLSRLHPAGCAVSTLCGEIEIAFGIR